MPNDQLVRPSLGLVNWLRSLWKLSKCNKQGFSVFSTMLEHSRIVSRGGGGGRGSSISDQSGTCVPLGSPFSAKTFRAVFKITVKIQNKHLKTYDFPEQVKFIVKALV